MIWLEQIFQLMNDKNIDSQSESILLQEIEHLKQQTTKLQLALKINKVIVSYRYCSCCKLPFCSVCMHECHEYEMIGCMTAHGVFTFLAATSNSTAFWYWACFMKKSEQRASRVGSLFSFRSSAISCRAPNCSVAKASSKALDTWPAWKGGMKMSFISDRHHLVVKSDGA